MIQYRPFCLTIWTPFIVALAIPSPNGVNVRSARRSAIEVVVAPLARRAGSAGAFEDSALVIRKRLGALLLLQDVHDVRE
jgi:hypothetical protein